MKKIKFEAHWCLWDGYSDIRNRLFAQYKTPEINFNNIEFVLTDDYDVAFCCNYASSLQPEKPTYIFPHEPHWNGSHQKNLQSNVTIFGFDSSIYSGGTCIETSMYPFYGGVGPPLDCIDVWNYDTIYNGEFKKERNISCSITTNKKVVDPTCLYPNRFKLINSLLNENYINLYGCTSLIEQGTNVKNGNKKIDFVSPYKFTLAVENTHSKNYITEKFYDAILTDCIPIYYGCSNIKELHPEDGYILIQDINDVESIKKLLIEVNNNADDIYRQKIDGARRIKQKLFKEHNPLKKIIEIANNL